MRAGMELLTRTSCYSVTMHYFTQPQSNWDQYAFTFSKNPRSCKLLYISLCDRHLAEPSVCQHLGVYRPRLGASSTNSLWKVWGSRPRSVQAMAEVSEEWWETQGVDVEYVYDIVQQKRTPKHAQKQTVTSEWCTKILGLRTANFEGHSLLSELHLYWCYCICS